MLLKESNTIMLLSGDLTITGLLQFNNVCEKFFVPLNSQNKNEGGDRVEHVLRQAENFTVSCMSHPCHCSLWYQ